MDLNIVWFCLVAVLFAGYAVLDGFDLGVGALILLAKGDENRGLMLNSIGPVWDGNEVWLVTAGGALFAAFPDVYATVFSGFYTALILLLVAIIFRAVSIELRGKEESARWRNSWERAFCASSILIALLLGVALGNVIIGIPIGQDKEPAVTLAGLLNPYSLLTGVTTVALFAMHGANYLVLKAEGELQRAAQKWAGTAAIVFTILYALTTAATLIFVPSMLDNMRLQPLLWAVPLIGFAALASIWRDVKKKREKRAFFSSAVLIAALVSVSAIGIFPNIVLSSVNRGYSLTIYNAASSQKTLGVMLAIALIGMPLVLAYTIVIYRVFRGKIKLGKSSY